MHSKYKKFRIGRRTLKTALAVILSMFLVEIIGASNSRLIYAMLGTMAAMERTLKDSVQSCLTQIVGMILGVLAGILLLHLPLNHIGIAGIGIVLVIWTYNIFHIKFSPSLPCLIVVTICTTPNIQPFSYGIERLWDTAIGLAVGLLINILVFPYNNSRQIQNTAKCLDKELILFLEDLFDGDSDLPNTKRMFATIDNMTKQLAIFSNQTMLLYLPHNKQKLAAFQLCAGKARQLVARMEVLSCMEHPGRLTEKNRENLKKCGAKITDPRVIDEILVTDIVTNYHIEQILKLRQELTEAIKDLDPVKKRN